MKPVALLLACTLSAIGAPSGPGERALEFLEQLRQSELNLKPGGDTALAPQTSARKRAEITRRLNRIADDLGTDPLEIGPVKQDGSLAGVLIRKIGGFSPNTLQVFPVAMILRESRWIPAPVPGSFENSGMGYAADLLQRIHSLEDWMMRQQVIDSENLRDQAAARMQAEIRDHLPAPLLESTDPDRWIYEFLDACTRRDSTAMLGFLGGLANPLPTDWALRMQAVETAVKLDSHPWSLLVSPHVIRAIVPTEDEPGICTLVCLGPSGSPGSNRAAFHIVRIETSQSANSHPQLELPDEFIRPTPFANLEADEDLDADLLDAFIDTLADSPHRQPTPTAESGLRAFEHALAATNPAPLLPLIRFAPDSKENHRKCLLAAGLWWDLNNPDAPLHPLALDFEPGDSQARASYQWFSARQPDRLDLRTFQFENTGSSWKWNPTPADKDRMTLTEWKTGQIVSWKSRWNELLLKPSASLDAAGSPAPAEEPSRRLITDWLSAVSKRDFQSALALTTHFDTPESRKSLIRNLGYEFAAPVDRRTIAAIHRGDTCTCVAVGGTNPQSGPRQFYPVVTTAAGPRLLLEVDLFEPSSRSRRFLNKTTLERIRRCAPDLANELENHLTSLSEATDK